jgi:sugar phosphate isomerase/epimerase
MLSISTTVFGAEHIAGNTDLIAALDIIKQSGFDIIEISRHQKNILARESQIRASGLKVWSIHGLLGYDAASDSATKRQATLDIEYSRMDDTACFAPCPYVVHYTNRVNNPQASKNYRKTIEKLYERSSQLGFDLAIETAPYKPQIDERYPDSKEISDFVRSFAMKDLNMTIDINHSNIHEDLIDVCNNCNGIISNVHISDNQGEWEDHLPPGEGIIDFSNIYIALRGNGYIGPFNLEFHLPNSPTVEKLRKIRLNVENMLSSD